MSAVFPSCAIVILNWNGQQYLRQFLPILLTHTPSHLASIYVIDNHSEDESLSILNSDFPMVKVISLSKNYGFAGGYQRGLQSITEDIICLLNSDVEVTEGWLTPILSHFHIHDRVAAIQPKILDLKNKAKFEYAGGSGGYYDRFGYAVCRGRYFDHIEDDLAQYDDTTDIFWASGCCIFVRNTVYQEVGGLDGDYFAHQEEIDLCWRINNYGYRVCVLPESKVYHLGGGSLPYGSYFKSYLNFRNSLFNLFKNLKSYQLAIILPTRMVLDGVAALHSMIQTRNIITAKSILHAHFSFYKSFGSLISKRKQIKHKGYPKTTIKKYILLDYYVFKCRKFSELVPRPKST